MRTLHLTLSKKPFEVMVTGEKTVEFRKPSKWIESRLVDKNGNWKDFDAIKFTQGYGKGKPYFISEYDYATNESLNKKYEYSNGLTVFTFVGDFKIHLGKIIEKGNI